MSAPGRQVATNLSSSPTTISSHSPSHFCSVCRLCLCIWLALFMSADWAGKTLSFFTQMNPPTCRFLRFFRAFLNSQICCSEPGFGKAVRARALPISRYTSVASYSECHQKSFNKWRQQRTRDNFNVMWIITSLWNDVWMGGTLFWEIELYQDNAPGDQHCGIPEIGIIGQTLKLGSFWIASLSFRWSDLKVQTHLTKSRVIHGSKRRPHRILWPFVPYCASNVIWISSV